MGRFKDLVSPTEVVWKQNFSLPLDPIAMRDLQLIRSAFGEEGFAIRGNVFPDAPRVSWDVDPDIRTRECRINNLYLSRIGYKIKSLRLNARAPWWESTIYFARAKANAAEAA